MDNKVYRPYINTNRGDHLGPMYSLDEAYDETKRLKEEYEATEACIKVYNKSGLVIHSWKKGETFYGKGAYLYSIPV